MSPGVLARAGWTVRTSLGLGFFGVDWDLLPGFGQSAKTVTPGEEHLCGDKERCSKTLEVERVGHLQGS